MLKEACSWEMWDSSGGQLGFEDYPRSWLTSFLRLRVGEGPFLKSLLNLLQYCFCFMFCFFWPQARGILALWPGIEPTSPALEGEILTTGLQGSPCLTFSELLSNQKLFLLPTCLLCLLHRAEPCIPLCVSLSFSWFFTVTSPVPPISCSDLHQLMLGHQCCTLVIGLEQWPN